MKYVLILLLLAFNAIAYDAFIKPEKLKELQNSDKLVLLDVSSLSSYNKSHITGAIHVDMKKFIKSTYTRLAAGFSKSIQRELENLGINEDSQVVIYSRNTDQLNTSYLALMFIQHGFENVTLLDGGYMAWLFEESSLVSDKKSKAPKDGNYKIKINKNILIGTDDLNKNISNSKVIDSRNMSKYCGKIESNDTDILGHIANAKHYYYKDSFYVDSTIKDDTYIEQNLISKLDIKRDEEVILYGDTIFVASMNWYILYKKFGFTYAKIYEEPFSKWVEQNLPLTTYK